MPKKNSKDFANAIGEYILEKKGKDVTLLDFNGKNDFAEFFIIATVESDPQVQAIGDHIERSVKENYQITPHHREGVIKQSSWFILDYFDVIVHLFKPEEREKFSLEKLWIDAKLTRLSDDKVPSDDHY